MNWWFVVEDVVAALTDSVNAKDDINKIMRRDEELSKGYDKLSISLKFPLKAESKR